MKKAIIVPYALGMVILTGLFLFGGSVADRVALKNRYFQLKEFTEKAAIGVANYYNSNQDIELSEEKTLLLMNSSPLYSKIDDNIEFIWESDDEVMVRIDQYVFQPFWMRIFGMQEIEINDINSTAKIVIGDEVESEISKNFMPIAINERDFEIGDTLTLIYKTLECSDIKCCDFDSGFGMSGSFGGFGGSFNFSSCQGFSFGCGFGGFGGSFNFGAYSCSNGFPWFTSMTFSTQMNWDPDDQEAFYAINLFANNDSSHGVSDNAHWKEVISGSRELPQESFDVSINLLKMMSNTRFLCSSVGQTPQLHLAINAFRHIKSNIFDIALVDDKADITGYITVNLNSIDTGGGELNIEVEVIENENSKKVKLVS